MSAQDIELPPPQDQGRQYTSSQDDGYPTTTTTATTTTTTTATGPQSDQQPPGHDDGTQYDDDGYQQPPPAIGDPRNEMISQAVMGRNDSVVKFKKIVQIIVNLIEIILVAVLVPLHWGRYCNRSGLRVFLLGRAGTDVFLILNHIWLLHSRHGGAKTLRTLLSLVEYGFVLFALIELGEVKSCNGSTLGLSISFVIVTFLPLITPIILLLLICCCLPCFLRALVRWVELQDAPEGATEQDLDSLETFKWTPTLFKEHKAAQSTECPICMIDYDEDSDIMILPCHHGLHQACLVSWLKLNKTCPMCRSDPFNAAEQHPDLARQTTTTNRLEVAEQRLESQGYSRQTIDNAKASVANAKADIQAERELEQQQQTQQERESQRLTGSNDDLV